MMQLIQEVAKMGDDTYAELAVVFCEAFEGASSVCFRLDARPWWRLVGTTG